MKNFFEFIGFVSTALISGFLVFSYVGHKKNTDKPMTDELLTAYNVQKPESAPEFAPISSSRTKASKEKRQTPKGSVADYTIAKTESSASVTERLRDLYNDGAFVRSTVSQWKKNVAAASETHSVKPHLLMANVIVKSYLGNYTAGEFNRDVSEHAGDMAVPASAAVKSYDYAWSVGKVAQQFDLAKYFPAPMPVASANATTSFKSTGTAKKATVAKAKPAASMAPVEAGFREMVAKEEGFSSWQGLQRLGDIETKKRAEKRVKILIGAARVR